ncbi:integral membrane protein [Dactylonectria estremocensis]|uniref:Integral membrane protein n=1 Tax=Dactylonectria estremocensis TaxID=1079267 RepID=A0A9P9I7D6_9HYPO|nr:integral membrane protein [Dactylonectria estremocensis]
MAGEGGYRGGIDVTLPLAMTIAGFFAISLYNVLDINVQIFLRFRKRSGLYFWSLMFASWGIAVHSIGFLLQFFQLCRNNYANIVIITLGGVPMVIGFAVVLYSRLHLIVEDRRKIRWVLMMIVLSFVVFTVPPTVLNFGSNSPHPEPYIRPFQVYEKIMLFGFSAQEVTISVLYLWEARKMLRIIDSDSTKGSSRVLKRLIYVNILVILLDMTIIGTELGGAHVIQTTYKSAVYSVKLKLEFPVLNQLRVQDRSDVEYLNSTCYQEGRRIPWESGITVVTPLNRNRWNLNMEATLAFQRQWQAPLHIFVSEHKWKDGQPTEEEALMMLGHGDDSAMAHICSSSKHEHGRKPRTGQPGTPINFWPHRGFI